MHYIAIVLLNLFCLLLMIILTWKGFRHAETSLLAVSSFLSGFVPGLNPFFSFLNGFGFERLYFFVVILNFRYVITWR